MRDARIWILLLVFFTSMQSAHAQMGWRGDGTGRFDIKNPPTRWGAEENVLWKTKLPGEGKGAPVINSGRIYLHSYPHRLLCLRESDGKLLWKRDHPYKGIVNNGQLAQLQEEYDQFADPNWRDTAQSTPFADGRNVYSVFGHGITCAHRSNGEMIWAIFADMPDIKYAAAASPIIVGDKLIVQLRDLLALNIQTGAVVWRAKLPARHATPVVARVGQHDVVIHPAGAIVDVATGKIRARELFNCEQSSPIVHDGVIYVHSVDRFQAIRLPSSLDGTPERIWETDATHAGYTIASPVWADGRIYGVNRNGILEVCDAKSGKRLLRKRLGLSNKTYGGFTFADGLLFVADGQGTQLVLFADQSATEIARNTLNERTGPAPVFANNRMYLRGHDHLFCIGDR